MNYITQDLLKVRSGIITHQVNCQGVMGSGIALKIKNKWPNVFWKYSQFKNWKPGMIQLVPVNAKLWVCNLAGQEFYGHDKLYTDYDAVKEAYQKLYNWAIEHKIEKIHVPYLMGCNRAGGNWEIYSQILHTINPDTIICQYDS